MLNFQNVSHNDLVGYRARIDHIQIDKVKLTTLSILYIIACVFRTFLFLYTIMNFN